MTTPTLQVERRNFATDPLTADAASFGPPLAARLRDAEDDLLVYVIEYAKARAYAAETSTIEESWRMSIRGLSYAICGALESGHPPPPIDAGAPAPGALTRFAKDEAAKHRRRGIDIRLFLGLLKYYRQSYLDVVAQVSSPGPERRWGEQAILRFFDALEVELTAEWLRLSEPEKLDELQRTNRRMTNEKNKFLTIFESLADPAFVFSEEGRLQHANEAAAATFDGLADRERYYGASLGSLPIRGLGPLLKETHDQTQIRRELHLETIFGPRLFVASVRQMLDVSGKFLGRVVSLKDITERERAERERQHLEIQLRHAQRLQTIDQLAAGLAHDINTPLQYLSSNLEFLQSSLQSMIATLMAAKGSSEGIESEDMFDLDFLAEEMPDAVRQSWEGVQQVRNTLETLRSFGADGESSRRAFDLNRSVRAVTDLLRSAFAPAVEFELELNADLRDVVGDGSSTRQVLYDLLLNAGQAVVEMRGEHPDTPGRVLVRTSRAEGRAVIEVEDDGPGIPEDVRPHVFEPYFTTRGEVGGGGHGLAFVHRTVTQRGGDIGFDCPPSGGCRFTVRLPLVCAR